MRDDVVTGHRLSGQPAYASENGAEAALAAALRLRLLRCTPAGEFHNTHFRGATPAGAQVFVKLLDDRGYWERAVRAASLAERFADPTPRLLDHGQLDTGRWWLVYTWHDLEPFTPTPQRVRQAGALLGRWHHATAGMHLVPHFQLHDLDEELDTRVSVLRDLDEGAADRVDALRARWGRADLDGPAVAIHGDVHWRNFGVDRRTGELCWYDWENASFGHPVLDFGKLVDLAFDDPVVRNNFLDGYHQHATAVFPWPEAMRYVRLWCTTGVLVYALARGLGDFADHGRRILTALGQL